MGRQEEAVAIAEQVIRLHPEASFPWRQKSEALSAVGRYEEAVEASEQIIRLLLERQDSAHAADAYERKATDLTKLMRPLKATYARHRARRMRSMWYKGLTTE